MRRDSELKNVTGQVNSDFPEPQSAEFYLLVSFAAKGDEVVELLDIMESAGKLVRAQVRKPLIDATFQLRGALVEFVKHMGIQVGVAFYHVI